MPRGGYDPRASLAGQETGSAHKHRVSRAGNYRFLHGKGLAVEVFRRATAKNPLSDRVSRPGVGLAAMIATRVRIFAAYYGRSSLQYPVWYSYARWSHPILADS